MQIVVVGAGSVGANVAYRLAERGAAVTILDAGTPGTGTSSTSFAWLNAFTKTPRPYYDLNVASMAEHANLVAELGALTGRGGWHHVHGGLHWHDRPEQQAALRATAERLEAWGYPVQRISPTAAMELEPDLQIDDDIPDVIFTPSEGYVEMVVLIGALLDGAGRHGATIRPHTRVAGVLRAGTRVIGVELANGEPLHADAVVDCAGPAAAEVIALAGLQIPFVKEPGRLVYTSPVATSLQRPIHAPGGHFRPDGGGRIVLAHGDHDVLFRDEFSWSPEQSLAAVRPALRPFAGARVEATRVGVRPIPADRLPRLGPVPGYEGFYVAVSHSGVTLGPLWGRLVAAELLGGQADDRLAPFRPDRFVT